MNRPFLGEKIRARRYQLGLSLSDLAEAASVSKAYLLDIETRANPNPSFNMLVNLAAALGVTCEFLLGNDLHAPSDDVLDQAFFRRYQKMNPKAKKCMQKLLELFEDDA